MVQPDYTNWDASSIVAPSPPPGQPKYAIGSVDGVWYPRTPILDSAVKIDISGLSGTSVDILPAIPNVQYIIGAPSILVVDPTSFALVGFAGVLEAAILGADGSAVIDAIFPLGAGFAAPSVSIKTRPGVSVAAAMYSTPPAAGVAYLWVPFTKVVLGT